MTAVTWMTKPNPTSHRHCHQANWWQRQPSSGHHHFHPNELDNVMLLPSFYCILWTRWDIPKADLPRYKDDYIKLYIDTIRPIVLKEDNSRPFLPSSPSNGVDTEAEGWVAQDPQSPRFGDSKWHSKAFILICCQSQVLQNCLMLSY